MSVTAQRAIDALIALEGDKFAAAERLGISPGQLVAAIAADPQAPITLNAQLRTLATLKAFQSLHLASVVLDASLGELEPRDLVKLVSSLSDQLQRFTDDKTSTQNVNITEVALRMLPVGVREAMLTLVSGGDTIEHIAPARDSNASLPPAGFDSNLRAVA